MITTVTTPDDFVVLSKKEHEGLLKAAQWEARYQKLARNLRAILLARKAILIELDN